MTAGGNPGSRPNDAITEVMPLTQPAERVQAQLFAEILGHQVVEMSQKVETGETKWRSRCETGGYVDPPERLMVVRDRIEEVQKMLQALDARFLRRP